MMNTSLSTYLFVFLQQHHCPCHVQNNILSFSRVSLFKKVMILNAGVCLGRDLNARIALAFRWFEDFSWILIDSNRSEVQPLTNTFLMRILRSSLEASWQTLQSITPVAWPYFSRGRFSCQDVKNVRFRCSCSYSLFDETSFFFLFSTGCNTFLK